MDFDSSVGVLFQNEITKVDSRLQVCRNAGNRFQELRQRLFHIIDKMGEASARAQGLPGAITTGRKLEMSEHHLYIMKDSETNQRIIGFLKIGRKRLFVYDRHGQQWEMNPLCILDFYVHESRQRMGCGRRLFDFMLQSEAHGPQHFAIDRPSLKFSSFLAKHYGLRAEIPQVNNFVIFEGFFTNRPGNDFINNRRNGNTRPADFAGSDGTQSQRVAYNNNYNKHYHYQHRRPMSGNRANQNAAGLPSSRPSPQNVRQEYAVLKELNLNPRSAHNIGATHGSPVGRNSPKSGYSETDLRSLSAGSDSSRGMGLQSNMYSRHHTMLADKSQSQYNLAQRPPSGAKNRKPEIDEAPPLLQRDGPPRDYINSFNMHQDYQGRGGHLKLPPDPRGTLPQPSPINKVGTTAVTGLPSLGDSGKHGQSGPQDSSRSAFGYSGGYYTRPVIYTNGDNSWTVTGVLRNQNYLSARHYSGHSRLW